MGRKAADQGVSQLSDAYCELASIVRVPACAIARAGLTADTTATTEFVI